MGKLVEGKELRNLLRLARYLPGTSVFGQQLSRLGASQVDALIMVMNRELRDEEDRRANAAGTKVFRYNEDDLPTDDIPEEL